MATTSNGPAGERGQILPLVAMWFIALLGMIGLAIDGGLMFIARAELRRDVDAAALAAIVELPNTANVQARAAEYLAVNEPLAVLSPISYPGAGQIELVATKETRLVFLPVIPGISAMLINGDSISISGSAVAGSGLAMDVGIILDDTGTMRSGCNAGQTNVDCPIKQARDGANALIDIIGVGDGTGSREGSLDPVSRMLQRRGEPL